VTAAPYDRGGALQPGVSRSVNLTGEYEQVDHPDHYNQHPAGIECIDVIEHLTFNTGSAIKYAWRAGLKPGADALTDLRKARWYLDREIARLNRDEP
jgi:hypothetical protein